MFKLTDRQKEMTIAAIEHLHEWANNEIIKANQELNSGFLWAYDLGCCDMRCRAEMVKSYCQTFLESKRDISNFFNKLFEEFSQWYPSNSSSPASRRYTEIRREAMAKIIETVGNICPAIKSGTTLKPLFE